MRNQSRFRDQIEELSKNLKDGESIVFENHWDAVVDPSVFSELYYASGLSQISSAGKFTLTRKGDEVVVSGSVNNVWADPYNWNAGMSAYIPGHGNIPDDDGTYLQNYGGAKPYLLISEWKTAVTGKITLRSLWFNKVDVIFKEQL